MSVVVNAKGTSVPYFTIGKSGVTLYQGTSDPSQQYSLRDGDYWLDKSINALKVWSVVSMGWEAPRLADLHFVNSSIVAAGGQDLVLSVDTGNYVTISTTQNTQSIITTDNSQDLHINPVIGGGQFLFLNNNRWPVSDGSSGQVLQTNGAGILSWVTAPASSMATNLAGGLANEIPFQSAPNVTTFSPNLTWNNSTYELTLGRTSGNNSYLRSTEGVKLNIKAGNNTTISGQAGDTIIGGGDSTVSGISGNVRIQGGTSADQGGGTISLYGGAAGTSGQGGAIGITGGTGSSSNDGGYVQLTGGTAPGSGYGGNVNIYAGQSATNGNGGEIVFFVASSGTPSEKFRIKNTGALSFNGFSNTGSAGQMLVSNGSNSPPSWQTILTPPAGFSAQIQYNNGGVFGASTRFSWIDANNRIELGDSSSTAVAVGAYGQTLIGGTSQSLNIAGSSNSASSGISNGGDININAGSTSSNSGAGGNVIISGGTGGGGGNILFQTGTSSLTERMRVNPSGYLLVGYATSNGAYNLQVNSQIFATNATIATSDVRYKENIKSITDATKLIEALNPITFTWKEHSVHNFIKGTSTGFLAQEVREAFKDTEFVDTIVKENSIKLPDGTDEEFLGLADGQLIALLVAAFKEQSAEIKLLKKRLAALENK